MSRGPGKRDAAEQVGVVKAIYRYPVKSMGGESLSAANLRWSGVDGDRQYAFYRATNTSRFPWFTGRTLPALVTYSARYLDVEDPRHSAVSVCGPEGEWSVDDPDLRDRLSRAAGQEIRLIQVGRGTFDSMPISVLSTATLDMVEAKCAREVDGRRFRANILVETKSGPAGRETNWVGRTLVFGDRPDATMMRANLPIDRCVMVTIDPDSGVRDPAILRCVVEDFGNEIGVRGATEAMGMIAVGDAVRLLAP